MLRLLAHRPVPVDAEPGEVLENCCGILVVAAGPVDILEPKQKTAPAMPRRAPSLERRADVTEMQIPGRAWRKACHRRGAIRRCGCHLGPRWAGVPGRAC